MCAYEHACALARVCVTHVVTNTAGHTMGGRTLDTFGVHDFNITGYDTLFMIYKSTVHTTSTSRVMIPYL